MEKRNRNTLLVVLAVVLILGGGTYLYLKKRLAESEQVVDRSQVRQ